MTLSTEAQAVGRFYTPPRLAELILAVLELPEGTPPSRLWDPTCGDGAFLRAAVRRGASASSLVGTDIDQEALAALGPALPGATLLRADLFAVQDGSLGSFDRVAGNPPFLRTERVPAAARAVMRERVATATGVQVGGAVDTSLLALAWCLGFLRPGGRLGFVLPSTALDVASGAPLRAWIASEHHVELVFDSLVEPWFVDAAVNTVVVVVRRGPPGPTRFARLRTPAAPELAAALLRGEGDASVTVRTVAAAALSAPAWSPLLRSPAAWTGLLDAAGPRLVATGERLDLRYGVKTGIRAFFSPRPPPDVEPTCLVPFLATLRDQHAYRVRAEDTEDRLFLPPAGMTSLPPRAQRHVDRGAARTSARGTPWPTVPSVRSHSPWWRLPTPRTGPVLVPQFRAERHHVIDNPDGLLVNNSAWHGTWRDPAHHGLGIALLNSTLVALGAEVLGRTNLGEGLLTLYGPELRAVPMPDPAAFTPDAAARVRAAWEPLARRRALPLADEVVRADRAALDTAVLDGLGLPRSWATPIGEAAVGLMASRLGLARARRLGYVDQP